MLIAYDIIQKNGVFLGIFAAIIIGLWTMKINIADALMSKIENKSIVAWIWFFVAVWAFFFIASILKARKEAFERREKAEKAKIEAEEKIKEKQQNEKHQTNVVTLQNEVKEKGVKLTEDQMIELKSFNTEIVQSAQHSIESKIQNDLSDRDKIIVQKMETLESSVDKTIEELEKEKKWYNHLTNYIHQFPASELSTSRARSFSSSTL